MSLFQIKKFTSHSGKELTWKIDCDALTDEDIECLAELISGTMDFHKVYGIPTGGLRLAKALEKYVNSTSSFTLVVDDVLTTGESIKPAMLEHSPAMGVVIFSRSGVIPPFVYPIFQLDYSWGDQIYDKERLYIDS